MRLAYGDIVSGISGDMMVGALLNLGLPLAALKAELKKIPLRNYRLDARIKTFRAIHATRFCVYTSGQQVDRTWSEIRRLIERSALQTEVKACTLKIFARLAAVEGKVHRMSPDRVRFHEIGATDSIIDIVSTAIGVHYLKVDSVQFSRIPLGRGLTPSRHGVLPLPGPATLELLRGLPVEWIDVEGETVTPTGAAIMAALGSNFGDAAQMTVEKIGYGAGAREFPDRPNVLRLVLGNAAAEWGHDEKLVIETNIDDLNPEFYDYVLERLFTAGALDVSLSPIQMKKNRPGTLLRTIAEPALRDKLAEIIFRETSTSGLRYYPVKRFILNRRASRVRTRFGTVKIKIIEEPGGMKRAAPEYEALKKLAAAKKIPLKLLHDEVLKRFKG